VFQHPQPAIVLTLEMAFLAQGRRGFFGSASVAGKVDFLSIVTVFRCNIAHLLLWRIYYRQPDVKPFLWRAVVSCRRADACAY
jgi:hypothetical protein